MAKRKPSLTWSEIDILVKKMLGNTESITPSKLKIRLQKKLIKRGLSVKRSGEIANIAINPLFNI